MEFDFDTVCKELRELGRAADMVLEKTKGAPDILTDLELRLLEYYIIRLHSGLAFAKTAAKKKESRTGSRHRQTLNSRRATD